jgi:hypothetical protein
MFSFSTEGPKKDDEEYKFGGYEPSSAVAASSRPSSHRSVRYVYSTINTVTL